jgi:hypothetical protein
MKMAIFIYTPKSGNRVTAVNTAMGGALITYCNQSHHALGFVELPVVATAMPTRHWRTAARHATKLIVEACGGVAWDENGDYRVAVPAFQFGLALDSLNEVQAYFDPRAIKTSSIVTDTLRSMFAEAGERALELRGVAVRRENENMTTEVRGYSESDSTLFDCKAPWGPVCLHVFGKIVDLEAMPYPCFTVDSESGMAKPIQAEAEGELGLESPEVLDAEAALEEAKRKLAIVAAD